MAAVFSVYLDTGGSNDTPGSETDIDALGPPALRFKDADNPTIDTNNPIVITAATTKRSRWKQIYLYCDTAPSLQVDNLKFYTDGGGFGTGITVNVGDQFPVKNSGSDAGYEVSDTSDEAMTGHADISSVTDVFTYTSGSPLSGPSISESGNIIDAIGETSNYIVLQMEVTDTASPGDLANETFTFQYDEI